jgi:endonuclease/exonuclease/phosphatase family metal-dependent hydrolase
MRRAVMTILLAAAGVLPAAAAPHATVRIATFNSSLNRAAPGELLRDLSRPDNAQARAVAEIVQRTRPDILLLQEFDYDAEGRSLAAFQANYLGVSQNGQQPIRFEYTFFAESNTGIPSGFDLDRGERAGADALGFGEFPGQYAMVLLSRFEIDATAVRTFRKFLWRDMPGAMLPDDAATASPRDWYPPEALAVLPLSSKSHWDLPIRIGKRSLHLLISHPTPPAFDGPEDRNGLRNHDEIRFWSDYLEPRRAHYIRDDAGRAGGFDGKAFVVMGDLNSDPVDGDSLHDSIEALIHHPRIDASFVPRSAGAVEAGALQGGVNGTQRGDPRSDTADFSDRFAGNLRVDYLLPSKGLRVCGGGVFWPPQADARAKLVWGDQPAPSSDHRLVWLDVSADAARCPPGNDPTASDPSHPGR